MAYEICRDVRELNVLVQVMLKLAIADIIKQGVTPLIVETYRSQERQNMLYCKGRTVAEVVAMGINSSFAKAHCDPKAGKVTWTLNSVHKSRKAVDIVPQRKVNGKMTAIWNAKDLQTQIIIKTMEKYGFEAGANWKTTPDSPHFQVKGDFDKEFDKNHNTVFVTKAIQAQLNKKLRCNLKVDGIWGNTTTDVVNKFRKSQGYKDTKSGKIGTTAFKDLFS